MVVKSGSVSSQSRQQFFTENGDKVEEKGIPKRCGLGVDRHRAVGLDQKIFRVW